MEHALTSLERAAGVTLVFLLTLEVLDQFALTRATPFAAPATAEAAQQRDKMIESHLRLVSAKQMSARFMLRLNLLRSAPHSALYGAPLRRLPI